MKIMTCSLLRSLLRALSLSLLPFLYVHVSVCFKLAFHLILMCFFLLRFAFFFLPLRIKPRTLHMLEKCFTTELHSQFLDVILNSARFLLI